jgi:hypothetical protein
MFKKLEINSIKPPPIYVSEDGFEIKISMKDLMNGLDKENKEEKENKEKEEKEEKKCLITDEVVTEPFVELDCGHVYNYIPLYKDTINQKKKFAGLDIDKLNLNEIRCPYCRKKQNKLLPFYELPGIKKIHGVNWLDETILTNTYNSGCCEYVYHSLQGEPTKCTNNLVIKISNGKSYCYFHQKIVTKNIAKEHAKEEKAKAKQAAKEALLKEKELKKLALQKEKENLVVVLCQIILKSGARKGEPCGQKSVKENCCLRHYNLGNK